MSSNDVDSKLTLGIRKYIDWILRWRWPIVLVTIIVTFLIASGARFLRFDTDYRVFFGDDNPQLQSFEAIQDIYTKNDNILFVIHGFLLLIIVILLKFNTVLPKIVLSNI